MRCSRPSRILSARPELGNRPLVGHGGRGPVLLEWRCTSSSKHRAKSWLMADGQSHTSESWRVVVFTNVPGGVVYSVVDEVIRPLGHRVVGVVTSPGPKRRRSASYLDVVAAVRPGIDVIVSNHPERWAAMLAPFRPDLIVSGGMPWRIPADVIALSRLGGINMHPALLPRYRGPAAIEWALRNGDAEMGFTIHRLASDFDTGPILAQARIPVVDEDDIDSLISKFGPLLPGLLVQAL